MTVTTTDAGTGMATGEIQLAPSAQATVQPASGSVIVSDGALTDEKTFSIVTADNIPSMTQPVDMEVEPGRVSDQALTAVDVDGDALTFSLAAGPWFATVSTIGPGSGNIHLTPVLADSGVHDVGISVSDGSAADVKFLMVTIPSEATPVLDQPRDMTVSPGQSAWQSVRATDLDGQWLSFNKVAGPGFMQVSTARSNTPGLGHAIINLAPQLSDSPDPMGGQFQIPATVGVTDGVRSDAKSFLIHISFPQDHPPVLEQPEDMVVEENYFAGQPLNFSDPDGEPVGVSKVSGPAFMQITWMIILTPSYSDAGEYSATIQATDSRGLHSEERSFRIVVMDAPAWPELEAPHDMVVIAGRTANQEIHASDPDGDPLSFSKYQGPTYANITTVDAGNGTATGNIRLAPTEQDVGRDTATVCVSDGVHPCPPGGDPLFLHNMASFAIDVAPLDRPTLHGLKDLCLVPGLSDTLAVRAVDSNGDRLSFSIAGLPQYATFSDRGDGTAMVFFHPAGSEPPAFNFVTLSVTDGVFPDSAIFGVSVGQQCSFICFDFCPPVYWPTSRPGSAYAGYIGVPVHLDGSASSDPDGQTLEFAWNLGDGGVATGSATSHIYTSGGRYFVELIVSDGLAYERGTTSVVVADAFPSRAAASNGRPDLQLDTGVSDFCVRVEPIDGYTAHDVVPSSIVMKRGGAGAVRQIPAVPNDSETAEDLDRNGVEEFAACFRREDLRTLLSDLTGHTQVTVDVEGLTSSGVRFRAPLTLVVSRATGKLAASVFPNPLNPSGTLSFVTAKNGPVKVLLFDLGGRLVRVLMHAPAAPAGHHDVKVDGRAENGERLASGIYFYRIETVEGSATGRIGIVK
jgi:PKD repeat protein